MMARDALHADDVLNRAADAQRQIELWRNRLAGRSDLAIHGEPSRIADGTRRRKFAAQCLGQLFGQFDVFLLLDAAADGNDDFRLRQIHRLLGFFEDFLRLVANQRRRRFQL